ncbi:pyridoxal phosphate-dependent aminotransferase [Metaclostridioides mangenotii]|uniref:Threonine-phosphate decarboxylase n=1 Tax=Metaclostridioides mangenotii TaxID=1540 RepID=A0ABS4EA89_9FIRM|nr:histidinol-phosphate transaminase [Clostridioides mangenotii]MBP1854861.1 threonine-phosphate decarboxylase [Clostridioides mangenotii]
MKNNHGANLYDLSRKYGFSKEEFMDFSSNINPFGASQKAKDFIINNIDFVSMYPDPDYINLKKSISGYCKCKKENMILGSGATELISQYINTIKPKKSLLLSPAYSEYEKELNLIGSKIDKYFNKSEDNFKINVDNLISHISNNKYDIIVICNPNNPTGFAFTKTELEKILKSTDTFIMVDETYIEFTDTDIYSATQLVDDYPNLFVIRGTSKFFSTPGIRLGYGLISNDDIKNKIQSHMDLWNINVIASNMGEIMFADESYISETINAISDERSYLLNELGKIDKIEAFDTQGNFILCKIKSGLMTAADLRMKLIPNKIIVRDCASFEGLDECFFRVCTLKHEENKLLIKSLNEIFCN